LECCATEEEEEEEEYSVFKPMCFYESHNEQVLFPQTKPIGIYNEDMVFSVR
jgi:hypothetical protein